jgi:hypothetical protein
MGERLVFRGASNSRDCSTHVILTIYTISLLTKVFSTSVGPYLAALLIFPSNAVLPRILWAERFDVRADLWDERDLAVSWFLTSEKLHIFPLSDIHVLFLRLQGQQYLGKVSVNSELKFLAHSNLDCCKTLKCFAADETLCSTFEFTRSAV